MTPAAAQILEMIETVDPNDTAKLDEIDHRVFCYVEKEEYIPRESTEKLTVEKLLFAKMILTHGYDFGLPKYTRSRDALKAIRPEGWFPGIWMYDGGNRCIISGYVNGVLKELDSLLGHKTEELAELHAIIQAIDFERTKK